MGGLAGAHACWQWRCLPQRRAEGLGDMLGQTGQAGQSTGQFPSRCLHAGTGSQDVCAHSSFFKFIYFSWRLITLQYCSGFCPTLIGISHGCTCVPHPEPPPTSLPIPSLRVIPLHWLCVSCFIFELMVTGSVVGLWGLVVSDDSLTPWTGYCRLVAFLSGYCGW